MHEASIALSILDIAEAECRKAGLGRVRSVEVRVGSASGVLPSALVLAFDIAKADTLAAGATLVIREIPLGGLCAGCGERFSAGEQFILSCPLCGSGDFRLDCGRELDVASIEAE